MSHLQIRVLPWLVLALLMTGVAGSWLSDGIVFQLIRSDITGPERVACLQQFFHEAGNWAPAAYVLCVTIEVIVAPIPGVLLYAPGGLIFGPLAGGLLALIGNMLGAGISCGLTRSLGSGWLQHGLDKFKRATSTGTRTTWTADDRDPQTQPAYID